MPRIPPKKRKFVEVLPDSMPIERDMTPIKPPTPEEQRKMRKREFQRKRNVI